MVIFPRKTKFQAKYAICCDRDATIEKASSCGLRWSRSGGRPDKSEESPQAQLEIKLGMFSATLLFSVKCVQVYWPGDYEDIEKIEDFLNKIVVFTPAEGRRFGQATRQDVETRRLYERKLKSQTELTAHYERMLNTGVRENIIRTNFRPEESQPLKSWIAVGQPRPVIISYDSWIGNGWIGTKPS